MHKQVLSAIYAYNSGMQAWQNREKNVKEKNILEMFLKYTQRKVLKTLFKSYMGIIR